MKMNKFKKRCYSKTTATAFMFACLGGLTACSDNDLDLTGNNENGTAVNFTVSMADKDAQAAAKANPAYAATRAGFAEQLSYRVLPQKTWLQERLRYQETATIALSKLLLQMATTMFSSQKTKLHVLI